MGKTICEMNKSEKLEKQADPKYICKRCSSVARKKKHLCKPKKIKNKQDLNESNGISRWNGHPTSSVNLGQT
jgi:hypothetical protein